MIEIKDIEGVEQGFSRTSDKKIVEEYAESIKDKILSEEDIRKDLIKLIPQPYGYVANIAWFYNLRYEAKRLAKFNPEWVDSVEDFEDFDEEDDNLSNQ